MLGRKPQFVIHVVRTTTLLLVLLLPGKLGPAVALPVVSAVVDGATLEPARAIAGSAWVTIFGSNLAPKTREWTPADFVNDRAPTSLEGVAVRINRKPAFISFLMRGSDFGLNYDQINVLAPADDTLGSVPVEVVTPAGTSPPLMVAKSALAPAFFPFAPQGRRYLAAITADGVEYLGPSALFGSKALDRPIRPARFGEVITLFGSGFGPTSPQIPEGSVARTAAALAKSVTIRFGAEPAQVEYAGTAPNLAGVYQFNVRVPMAPVGEVEVTAEIDGIPTLGARWMLTAEAPYPTYDHGKATGFRLTGAHVFVDCTLCHLRSRFVGTPTACVACHLTNYESVKNPDHVASGFPKDCAACHKTSRFAGAVSHLSTSFVLTGAHASLQCAQCHTSGQFTKLPSDCANCHLARYQATSNPNHAAAGFPKDCAVCHDTTRFAGAKLDHSKTRFPLNGAHTALQCANCHASGQYAGLNSSCMNCHLARYEKTTNPNHAAAGLPKECALCHNTTTFAGATFDHSKTRFPLAGVHVTLQCSTCHASGQFSGLNTDCASCHLTRYNATTSPNHAASGFPVTCALCHNPTGWKGAVFSHTTRFQLTGAHQRVQCTSCHVGGRFAGTSQDCAGCHLPRYNATTNPNHRAAGFPTDCALCHSTTQFLGARFLHASFSLTGAHTALQCSRCHSSGQFAGTPTDCVNCHLAMYTATTNPNHVTAGFPRDCALCHTTTQFRGAVFTHSRFPIYSGAHSGKWSSCATCHVNAADFKVFSCFACHDKARTDSKHSGVRNYIYNSSNCYACHPTGKG